MRKPFPIRPVVGACDHETLQMEAVIARAIVRRGQHARDIRDRWQLLGIAYTEVLALRGPDYAEAHALVIDSAVGRLWNAMQMVRSETLNDEVRPAA